MKLYKWEGIHRKRYSYDEWTCTDEPLPKNRTYTDLDGNPITGIIEGFYYFMDTKLSDDKNCRRVKNGRIC